MDDTRPTTWPVAIDPVGCGCTECLTGEYVPLDRATDAQLVEMLTGKRANNIGLIALNFGVYEGRWELLSFDPGDYTRYADDLGDLGYDLRRIQPSDIDC